MLHVKTLQIKLGLLLSTLFLLSGCLESGGQVEGWINETLERSSISSGNSVVSVNEGSSLAVVVLLSSPIKTDADLNWEIVSGPSAKFVATSGVLHFAKGEQSKTLQIDTLADPALDGTQSYVLRLSGSITVFANALELTLNVLDLDSPPVLSVSNVTVAEGNTGDSNQAVFTVTASRAAPVPVSFTYTTGNGTASSSSDYTMTSGTGNIAVGASSMTISVPITGDNVYEADETFTMTLSGGSGYIVAGSSLVGTGTIQNDDSAPTVSIANVSQAEGDSSTGNNMQFTVTLSAASNLPVVVAYATSNSSGYGKATANMDYTTTSSSLTIPAGSTSGTFNVPILGDTTAEPDEVFTVTLSAGSGFSVTGSTLTATGTIQNDDAGPTLTLGAGSVNEGNSGNTNMNFTVTLTAASGANTVINYSTSDNSGAGAAVGDTDYSSTSGSITISAGSTSGTISIPVIGDTVYETDETFTLSITGGSGYTTTGSTLTNTGTIRNDDSAPTVSVSNVSRAEGDSGSANMTFTVNLSALSEVDAVVHYATSNGSGAGHATSGSDYTATSGDLTISAGTTSGTFTVPVLGDTTYEGDEIFTVTLSLGSGFSTSGSTLTATGTIQDNDPKEYAWDFASLNPSGFTFDSTYIDFTNGSVPKLKKFAPHTATQMASGTHNGTKISGSVLTLDSSSGGSQGLAEILPAKAANLMMYYRGENNLNDSSGNNRPANLYSGTKTFSNVAKVGSFSYYLDGATRYDIPGTSAMTWGSFTRFAWVNVKSVANGGRIISQQGGTYWIMSIKNNMTLRAYDTGGGAFDIGTSETLQAGQWYQIAIVRDMGVNYRFYINGNLSNTVTVTNTVTSAPGGNAGIGGYLGGAGNDYIDAYVDEIAVWNTALSTTEIKTIFDAQKARYVGDFKSPVMDIGAGTAPWTYIKPVTTYPSWKPLAATSESATDYASLGANLMQDILGVWHFDETSGTTFADSTAAGLTATASSAPTTNADAPIRNSINLARASTQCLTTATTNLGSAFSFSGWARVNPSTTTAHTLFANANQPAGANGFKFYINTWNTSDGAVSFETGDGTTTSLTAKTAVGLGNAGTWHHYVVTVDRSGGVAAIYVDGILANASNQTIYTTFNTSAVLRMGCMANSTGFLDGSIDEFAVWKRVLTANEVRSLYRRGATRTKYQVRSCASNPCNEGSETWKGPDGSANTYFSELYNYDTVTNGVRSGVVRPGALQITFNNYSSAPANARFFQYRVFMESDDNNSACLNASNAATPCLPEVSSVVTGPEDRYWANSPAIVNNTAITIDRVIAGITRSDSANACTKYQVSIDGGTTWKFHNGSSWVNTSNGVDDSNFLSDITALRWTALGAGPFKFKAFLNTNSAGDFTQSCQLNSLLLKYDAP